MSNTYKVSVIVPFFNAEHCIERCARTLLGQTLAEIEYIFVNDGSTDNSVGKLRSIVEEYPQRMPHVKIESLDCNKGSAEARKTGILAASGEYMIHCDADDWVEPDMYEKLYEMCASEELDIICCGYCINVNGNDVRYESDNQFPLHYSFSLVDKLCKRTLFLNDISFPRGDMIEDQTLTFQLYHYARKIKFIEAAYYHYCIHDNSITGNKSEERCLVRLEQVRSNVSVIEDFIKKINQEKRYKIDLMYMKFAAKSQLTPIISKRQYLRMWRQVYSEINIPFLFSRMRLKIKMVFAARLLGCSYQIFGR